jgi:hypothetical protein
MKYEQPYGISDPNGSYINGNPSTGTMGSIPPAASIENPQREIVNLIADAGGTPSDADLHQLGKGVQSGRLIYAEDFGIPNSYLINTVPALTAYAAGQRWNVKIANTNTGPALININSLGPRNIVKPNGDALTGNEMQKGAVIGLVDDGARLQLQGGPGGGGGGALLTAPMTYYVNATTGSDTLYDGTVATVVASTAHGPFATIQKAIDTAHTWNQNGFSVLIRVADGSYAPIQCGPINGAGYITLIGNLAVPSAVTISATAGEAILVQGTAAYSFQGFTVASGANGTTPHLGVGIRAISASCSIKSINFGYCAYTQLVSSASSDIVLSGTVSNDPGAFINISGDSPFHMQSSENSRIFLGGSDLNIIGSRTIGCFAHATVNGCITGTYRTYDPGAPVNGQKFAVDTNGVIATGGGVNYFPGNAAGGASSGGQYT